MRLTDQKAAELRVDAGKKETRVWDSKVPGFGARLRASGARTWIFQFRVGKQQRCMTIGAVSAMRAAAAREIAEKLYAKVKLGADPQAEKEEIARRTGEKLGPLFDSYVAALPERVDRGDLSPSTAIEVTRYLRVHLGPLSRLQIEQATRTEIAHRLTLIKEQSGPIAANRARATLSTFFTWAMKNGHAPSLSANPVTFTAKNGENTRNRVLSDVEIIHVWKACEDNDYGRIVRLLMLTGQRRSEVGGMLWAEINEQHRLWVMPGSRTKNGLQHEVPLSAPALDILSGIPRRDGRAMIFGEGDGPFSGWSKSKSALDTKIAQSLNDSVLPWVIHDLRRTVATGMSELGIQPHIVEAVLNHISGHKAGIAGVYNHAAYRREKREALERWGEHVLALVAGAPANVIALKRA